MGGEIEIFTSDDLDTFKKVFAEFVRTKDFYELPPPTQEYLRDVLVSIATAQAPQEEHEAVMASKNLKAVVVRGKMRPEIADKKGLIHFKNSIL